MSHILVKAPKKKKRALKPGEGAKKFGTAVKRRKGKLVDVRANEREKLEAQVKKLIGQKELELRDVESEHGKDSLEYKNAVNELRVLGERAASIAGQTSAPGEIGYDTYTDREGNVIERRPDSEDEPIGRKESTRLSTETMVGPGKSGKAALGNRRVNVLEEQRRINKPKEKIGVMGRGRRQKYGGAGRDTIKPARADPTETKTREVWDQDLGQFVDEMAGEGVTGQDSDPSNPTLIHSGDPMEPFHTDPTYKDLHEIIMRGKGDLLTDPETDKKVRGKGSIGGAINLKDMVNNLIYHKGELPIGIGREQFVEGDKGEDDFYTTGAKGKGYKSGLHLLEDLTGIKGLEKEWNDFKPRAKKQRSKKTKPVAGQWTVEGKGKGEGTEKQISANEEKKMFQEGLMDTVMGAIRADHNNVLGKLGVRLAFPKSAMKPEFTNQAIRGDAVNLGATKVKVQESLEDFGTQLGPNIPPNHPKHKENRRIADLLDGFDVPIDAQEDTIKRIKGKMKDYNWNLYDALDDTIQDLHDEGVKFDEPKVNIMGQTIKDKENQAATIYPSPTEQNPYADIKFPERVGVSGKSLTADNTAAGDPVSEQFIRIKQKLRDSSAAGVLEDLKQSAVESQLPVQQVFEEQLKNLRNQEEQGLVDAGTANKFSMDYQSSLTNSGYMGNEPELTQPITETDFTESKPQPSDDVQDKYPAGFQPLDETVEQAFGPEGTISPGALEPAPKEVKYKIDPITGQVIPDDDPMAGTIQNALMGYDLGEQMLKAILEGMLCQ